MDQAPLLLLCCGVGFLSGYGVRAIISLRHRREERRMLEARERFMQARAARNPYAGSVVEPFGGPEDFK